MSSSKKVRVAIIGVGNCAASLVQGVEYYKNAEPDDFVPGLMHVELGGYHIRDIEFTAAFDVVASKVGLDLSEAIHAHPNNTIQFAEVPKLGVKVQRGMTHDGIGKYLSKVVEKAPGPTDDIVGTLKETKTDVVVNFLPVGSEMATKWYVEQVLEAGCAFVNCIPVFIASSDYWASRFEERSLPVLGDDIKSQVGATIVHRTLVNLLVRRGAKILETYQLNIGGNTDFLNMTMEERLKTKRISKTEAVTSLVPYEVPTRIGPSDYVPFLGDTKICYIHIRALKFGGTELTIDLKLKVEDSPNSAGVVVDVIRAVKLALDRGVAGPLVSISAWAFKHPPVQVPDDVALQWVEEFIEGKRER